MAKEGEQRGRRVRPRRGAGARLRFGEAIYGASAAILLGVMFVSWYGSEIEGQAGEIALGAAELGGNAWQTLSLISLFLALTIAAAFAAVALRLSRPSWEPPIAPAAAVAVLGGIATLLVLFRLVFPPDLGKLGGIEVEATLGLGAFLALAAAFGVAYGGYRAMREEGSSFAAVADSLQPRRERSVARKR